MKKIVFVVNHPAYFVSHRLPIGLALIEQGNDVHVIGPGECPAVLIEKGFKFHSVDMSRKGMNPFAELSTILALRRLFKQMQPDLVHLVTIKPYLYGGIAARLAGVPAVVSAVAGLGTVFIDQTFKAKAVRSVLWFLYKFAFGHKNQKVIFQNNSDASLLSDWIGLSPEKIKLIRGSGVDLQCYQFVEEPNDVPVVTLVARLLIDKGVGEFVKSSRILRARGVDVRMCLVGDIDEGNRTSITANQLNVWVDQDLIEAWGYRLDIKQVYAESNIVCLPSYREGLPKSLVEAAACGRAVVTTDVPGCRDAIEPNLTGVLVPVRDAEALANAIQDLIESPDKRKAMGKAGRELAEKEFAIEKVVGAHLAIYDELL
ncbi:MAG: glycosyltransferase family 4 protein, partial [Gammaproteobacteria bacterium]|nr:glycosyltransferase family 4 protein [Gammaproteobacteria bacterium]